MEVKRASDIMSSILKPCHGIKAPEKDNFLQADARAIIVAGSDITAAAQTYLFYHLAQRPEIFARLRSELPPLTNGDWRDTDIRLTHYLNACITESLHLYPPVPSGVSRLPPAERVKIENIFVPPLTTFWIPNRVIHRGLSVLTFC